MSSHQTRGTVCYRCDECKAEELDAERAAFQRGSEHGQRFERAAIVAWLSTGCAADWWMAPDFAEAIERGDHLGGDDE